MNPESRHKTVRQAAALALALLLGLQVLPVASAATPGPPASAADSSSPCLVVTNTNNTGAGSLRDAINCANSTPGHDTITFDIPGAGPHTPRSRPTARATPLSP